MEPVSSETKPSDSGKGGNSGKGYAKGPGPQGPGAAKGRGKGLSWKEKAAAAAAEAAADREPFEQLNIASLPPGPVDAPRWETTFAVKFPAAGQTESVFFVATLAGSYVLKTSKAPAQEYFAARFLQRLGIPTPEMRIIFGREEEHAKIREALNTVAGQTERLGDSEGAHRLLLRSTRSFQESTPIMLMSFVPGAVPLGSASSAQVEELLDLKNGNRDAAPAVVARLHAVGRCWVGDAVLGFRDRFASPVSCRVYSEMREMIAQHGTNILMEGPPPTLFDQYGLLQGNADNLLLTHVALPPGACIAAIDNHVQHVNSFSKADVSATLGSETVPGHEHVPGIFAALLAETAGVSGPLAQNAASVEFFQHMVKENTGYVLNAAALCEVRLGALFALRDLPTTLEWAASFLAELQGEGAEATETEFWAENARRINGAAVQTLGRALCDAAEEHAGLLRSLPEAPVVVGTPPSAHQEEDEETVAEATAMNASPRLWNALSPALRAFLRRNPPRPVPWVPR